MSEVNELRKSVEMAVSDNELVTIIAGDFKCYGIARTNLSVRSEAQARDVQQARLDLPVYYNLTQVHDTPTRENSLLDLILTTNRFLIKSTVNTPGITDVKADPDTKPCYIKQKPRRVFTFSIANWDKLEDRRHRNI
ncbi:hypothetical protein DPMN_158516 [Dreissena polymorpha]|uniref:Uncharacterized protein n=1 Tax=Dreissena polymorpha TaxID=45954 RepID=A0A9D4IPV8_DREPO|nr:hypothetical protein DPMN_158516 [Dreissena polymorpha]